MTMVQDVKIQVKAHAKEHGVNADVVDAWDDVQVCEYLVAVCDLASLDAFNGVCTPAHPVTAPDTVTYARLTLPNGAVLVQETFDDATLGMVSRVYSYTVGGDTTFVMVRGLSDTDNDYGDQVEHWFSLHQVTPVSTTDSVVEWKDVKND